MTVITLRGLTDNAAAALKRRAEAERKSVNRYIVDLVEQDVLGQVAGKPREYTDLDDLFGSMTVAEGRAVRRSVKAQRRIDPELGR